MSTIQVQAQMSFDNLLRAALQLNPFEREQFAFRILAPPLQRRSSERLLKVNQKEKTQFSPEKHPFYQLLCHIMNYPAQLTPKLPYIKEVFRYMSVRDDIDTVISPNLAVEAILLIISLPDIEKYHPSIYVLEDNGLVLDFFRDQGRVFCILREQYAHIMGMLGDEMTEDLLQHSDFSINKTSTILQELFKEKTITTRIIYNRHSAQPLSRI